MVVLNLKNQFTWQEHRSGWKYALSSLECLHGAGGVIFDGCLDSTFGYNVSNSLNQGLIPYKEPWIGFFHSTVNISPWFYDDNLLLGNVLSSELFVESLDKCVGLFTFSDYVAQYIKTFVSTDVVSLKHPTEFPTKTFNYENFLDYKKVVHVGAWMRKMSSFLRLKAPKYKKIFLLNPLSLISLGRELNYLNTDDISFNNIKIIQRISNSSYDDLLTESIVFVDLFDSNANNTIIECIARNTPILVNKINAITEYLGESYPLYYSDIDEANSFIKDYGRIKSAHEYLSSFPGREQLTLDHFFKSFISSSIIKKIDN